MSLKWQTCVLCIAMSLAIVNAGIGQVADEVLHVNVMHPAASDENTGAVEFPLRTLQAAMDRAVENKRNHISTHVVVHEGLYREGIDFGWSNYPGQHTGDPDNDTPMVVEAEVPGTVIVSGSDVWSDWQFSAGVYVHDWSYDWGGGDIVERREMIFVDGALMTQVLSMGEVGAGTFYVDEALDKVYLSPPAGTDMASAMVEVAIRDVIWNQKYENNVTLRGIVFQHAVTEWRGGMGAVRFTNSNNLLVEDCQMLWNNWAGIYAGESENVTWRRLLMNHNGGQGWSTWRLKNFLAEDTETSYNNWRGALGEYYGWNVGNKLESMHGLVIRRHKATGNMSRGLWLDFDIKDAVVEDIIVNDNFWDGIWFEAGQGPFTLKNSKICDNGRSGLRSTYAEHVLIEGNVFYRNANAERVNVTLDNSQIEIGGAGTREVYDFETGESFDLAVQDWVLRNNTIVGGPFSHQFAYGPTLIDTYLDDSDWSRFVNTLTSDYNVWYHGEREEVFGFPRYNDLTFGEWQAQTGQDAHSAFSDPELLDVCAGGGAGSGGGSASHPIPLLQGWNIVSSWVRPGEADLDSVFAEVVDDVVLVKNGTGQVYIPELGINSIDDWDPKHGYAVFAQANAVLSIEGEAILPDTTVVSLAEGWNLIPYLRDEHLSVDAAFATIASELVIAKDVAGGVYVPEFNINTIGDLQPGQGYKVCVDQAVDLVYSAHPGPGGGLLSKTSLRPASSPAGAAAPGIAASAVLIVEAPALADGSLISVWSADRKALGSGIVEQGRAVIAVQGDEPATEDIVEGAQVGDALVLKVRAGNSDETKPLAVTSLTDVLSGRQRAGGALHYEDEALFVVQAAEHPNDFSLSQNYPNPFNVSTLIQYRLPADGHVKLEVYNMLSQRVAVLVDEEKEAGSHSVVFDAGQLASGVYVCRMKAGDVIEKKHMLLVK